DPLADVPATGEGDLADAWVGGEEVADLPARAGEALDPLRGHAGFEEDLRQLEGGQGRVGGRLDDDRGPAGQGRAHLVADEVQGEVEGTDGHDDPAGNAQGEGDTSGAPGGAVDGHRLSVDSLGFLGGAEDRLDGAVRLEPALGQD